jgi:diguanylate cyclase (GGDEF)-like protein
MRKRWIQRFAVVKSALLVPLLAGCAVVLFTVAAGFLVYANTQRLIAAADWVQHSQEVLSSLQRASLLTERIQYRSRLYLLTGQDDQLSRARTSANQLQVAVEHIRSLVADNAVQTSNVQNLAAQAGQLNQILDGFSAQSHEPEKEAEACQATISLMVDVEQSLLKARNLGSQRRSVTSIVSEIVFVVLLLLTLTVLFGFLLRDAVRRQLVARQMLATNERLERTVTALEDRAHETALLTGARDELQLCVNVQQVYDAAANGFWRLLPGTSGGLCIINNSRQYVEVVSSWGLIAAQDFSPPEACCGLRAGQSRWREPGKSEIHCSHFIANPPQRYLCRPIQAHGNALGILYVECASDEVVQSVNQRMDGLRQLLQITGMAIATLNLRSKLEHQSIRDALTGLFNRHFMEISLERELSRAARRNQMLAVLMLDVDHFKQFNDKHGHVAGDTVLKEVAQVFQAKIRAEDVACRYGGEEFTILLPDVTVNTACERAEMIREAVAALHVVTETQTHSNLSISIGIAFYPNDGESSDSLLKRADEALYRSKREGRNRLTVSQMESVSG